MLLISPPALTTTKLNTPKSPFLLEECSVLLQTVGKLDVGQLIRYFSNFGEIYDFRRVYNKDRTDSGYAFFNVDREIADVIVEGPHQLRNALINCKIAADSTNLSQVQKEEMKRKLYVSNLPANTSDLDLLRLFESFGRLTKAYLVRNRLDGTSKNFGFVIFETLSDFEGFLAFPRTIKFKGRKLTIKRAVDRQTQKSLRKSQGERLVEEPDCDRGLRSSYCTSSTPTKQLVLKQSELLNENEGNYRLNPRLLPRRRQNLTSLAVLKPRSNRSHFSASHVYTRPTFTSQ